MPFENANLRYERANFRLEMAEKANLRPEIVYLEPIERISRGR